RQGRLGAAAQRLGGRRGAPREDQGSRGGGARRRSRPRERMTAPVPPPPAFGRFFLPGPTDVHPEVLAAMHRPMIGHRSGAMEQLLAGIEAPLARLFRTARPVLVGTTSATGFMEMAVRNGVRHRALSLVNGSFSERFAKLVSACGKECVRLDVPLGCAVEPDMLRDTLRRTPVDAVTLVHSETSTGVLQDVEALAGVVREFDDVLLLVDAVTSLAGSPVETDRWGGGLDFVLTGSQKALALPPGLALGAASDRMLERARPLPAGGTPQLDRVVSQSARREEREADRRRAETGGLDHRLGVRFPEGVHHPHRAHGRPRHGRARSAPGAARRARGVTYRVAVADKVAEAGLKLLAQTPEIEVTNCAGKPREELERALAGAHALIVRSETRVTADLLT